MGKVIGMIHSEQCRTGKCNKKHRAQTREGSTARPPYDITQTGRVTTAGIFHLVRSHHSVQCINIQQTRQYPLHSAPSPQTSALPLAALSPPTRPLPILSPLPHPNQANTRRLKSQHPVASAYPSGDTPKDDTLESCGISQIFSAFSVDHMYTCPLS